MASIRSGIGETVDGLIIKKKWLDLIVDGKKNHRDKRQRYKQAKRDYLFAGKWNT